MDVDLFRFASFSAFSWRCCHPPHSCIDGFAKRDACCKSTTISYISINLCRFSEKPGFTREHTYRLQIHPLQTQAQDHRRELYLMVCLCALRRYLLICELGGKRFEAFGWNKVGRSDRGNYTGLTISQARLHEIVAQLKMSIQLRSGNSLLCLGWSSKYTALEAASCNKRMLYKVRTIDGSGAGPMYDEIE